VLPLWKKLHAAGGRNKKKQKMRHHCKMKAQRWGSQVLASFSHLPSQSQGMNFQFLLTWSGPHHARALTKRPLCLFPRRAKAQACQQPRAWLSLLSSSLPAEDGAKVPAEPHSPTPRRRSGRRTDTVCAPSALRFPLRLCHRSSSRHVESHAPLRSAPLAVPLSAKSRKGTATETTGGPARLCHIAQSGARTRH
jgi:hypothetical protein